MDFLNRLQETGAGGRSLAAIAGAAVQALLGDVFVWLLVWLLVANLCDYVAGRHAARARKEFSKTRSRQGVVAKGIAIAVVILVRGAELINAQFGDESGIPSTRGLFAAAITAWLFYEEVESLDGHRRTLGYGPIPLLSWALEKMRGLTGGERRADPKRPDPFDEPVESGGAS